MLLPLLCPTCNQTKYFYPSELKSRKYCSLECRSEANATYELSTCRWCSGKPARRSFRFCSQACRGAYAQATRNKRGTPLCPPAARKTRHATISPKGWQPGRL
jgi:hypothetical protein